MFNNLDAREASLRPERESMLYTDYQIKIQKSMTVVGARNSCPYRILADHVHKLDEITTGRTVPFTVATSKGTRALFLQDIGATMVL